MATEGLSKPEDFSLESHDVPNTKQGILSISFDPANKGHTPGMIIAKMTVRMYNHKKELSLQERQRVYDILKSFHSVEVITPEIEKTFELKWLLNCIIGECPKAQGPYEYPDPLPRDAAIVLAKVERDLSFEEEGDNEEEVVAVATSPTNRKRKIAATYDDESLFVASNDDPTYKSIMQNIEVVQSQKKRSYKIIDKTFVTSCNVPGHNGLEIGQWWPLRICALRDGAHGATVGGIAGGESTGAVSIVVSGTYSDLDKDRGTTLYYSGSNSHANKNPTTPIQTLATKSLERSFSQRSPIRVLRASGGNSTYSPSQGMRYDGLYRIVARETRMNGVGGCYLRFKLVRDGGQAEIDFERPTKEEKMVFERIKSKG